MKKIKKIINDDFYSHLKRLHMKADSSRKIDEELDSRKFGVSSTSFFSLTDSKILLIGSSQNVIEFKISQYLEGIKNQLQKWIYWIYFNFSQNKYEEIHTVEFIGHSCQILSGECIGVFWVAIIWFWVILRTRFRRATGICSGAEILAFILFKF